MKEYLKERIREYTFPSNGGTMSLDIIEPRSRQENVMILDAGSTGERLLTLIFLPGEIISVYSMLGADTHIAHTPREEALQGIDIQMYGDSEEVFEGEIKPRLDHLVEWSRTYLDGWAEADGEEMMME